MTDDDHKSRLPRTIRSSLMGHLRQLRFPAEFRIAMSGAGGTHSGEEAAETLIGGRSIGEPSGKRGRPVLTNDAVAEVATCLWYLKTRFFRQEWSNMDATSDDGRERRAIGRVNKTIASLREAGIEIEDPIRQRYPENGDATMKPVQLVPTDGIAAAVVTETATPIVYSNGRLIQRGEVYVAVPKHTDTPPQAQAKATPSDGTPEPTLLETIQHADTPPADKQDGDTKP